MINEDILGKLKLLYLQKFKIKLSGEEATKVATDFLNLMKILLRPEPKQKS